MNKTKHVQQYMTRAGTKQYRPSLQMAMILNGQGQGFCLACAHEQEGVEPDAVRYTCESCSAPKVYGAEQIVLMGLTFEAR